MGLSGMYAGQNKSPFSNALSNFMQAKQMASTNRLMAPAMSGDLSALNELMSVNPQAGMQVQQVMSKRQQQEAQAKQQQVQNQLEAMKSGIQYDPETGSMSMEPKGFQFEGGLTGNLLGLIAEAEKNPQIKNTPEYKLAIAQLAKPQYIQTEQGTMQIPGLDVGSVLGGRPMAQPKADVFVGGTEKTSPLQPEYNKKYQGLESFNKQFNHYRDLLEKLGPQMSAGPFNAKAATELETAYTALTTEAKNAFELGALAKDDLALIERFVANPTELAGVSKSKDALLGGLDQAADYFTNKAAVFEGAYEGENVKRKPLTKLKRGQQSQEHPSDIQDILSKYGTAK